MEEKRFWYQTDTTELERRWKVTLEAMDKKGIDVLLLHTFAKFIGGAAKYLTDIQANEYPVSFLFGKEGISIFGCGPAGGPAQSPDVAYRNVAHNVGVPIVPTSHNLNYLIPEEMGKIIKKYNHRKIGISSWFNIPALYYKYLKENIPGIEFVDFEEDMDYIQAVKSEYELGLYKACARLHDEIYAAAPAFLRIGRSEYDIGHDMRALAIEMGCAELNVMLGSGPKIPMGGPFMYAHRTIKEGDYLMLLLEVAAPGGVWGEVSRVFSFGEPAPDMIQADKDQLEVQAYIASLCVPGVKCPDIFNSLNERLSSMGYFPEKRFSIHGQGYDIVARPTFTAGETMVLKENMWLAIHPPVRDETRFGMNCDNYIVKPGGAVKQNKTPPGLHVINHFKP